MKHWKETVIKSEQMKWKRPPIKNIDDGKLDVIITIPLTELFEAQAKGSFAEGMLSMMQFHMKSQTDEKYIGMTDIVKLFKDAGLPEIAAKFEDSLLPPSSGLKEGIKWEQ